MSESFHSKVVSRMQAIPNASDVPTRAGLLLSRLENGGDIDGDYVVGLLNSALKRPLTLTEARYLERSIFDFQGPSDIVKPTEDK